MMPRLIESDIQHAGDHWVVVPRCADAKVVVVNATGQAVLGYCDGATAVTEICDRLGEQFQRSGRDVRPDVEGFLREAEESGIITAAPAA